MSNKDTAVEIYKKHIAMASTDGRLFRRTVMDEIMSVTGCSDSSAATSYNNVKKGLPQIEGLGRAPASKNVRRPGAGHTTQVALQDDNECFSVIELLTHTNEVTVGRCCAHLLQGDASEEFDERIKFEPESVWILIRGLGPNHGDTFKLAEGEEEIKRYSPSVVKVVDKEIVLAD